MNDVITTQLKWRIYRVAESLSLVFKQALALLLIVLLGYMLVYRPQQFNLANLTEAQASKTSTTKTVAPSLDLNAYTVQFPKLATRAAKINALIDIAKQQNLLLDEVTYKSEVTNDQPLNRYQMAFSLFVPYPEVHHFLSSILTQMPYVAVDSLNISRENVLDDVVEARVQLTFYFANTI